MKIYKMLAVFSFLLGPLPLSAATVSSFSGPTGLDLSGSFVYAVDFPGTGGNVSGVAFSGQSVPGVTIAASSTADPWGGKPEYGADADSNTLENIMYGIRYNNGGTLTVGLGVTPGQKYKLQLLFSENYHDTFGDRIMDVSVEGAVVAPGFDPLMVHGLRTPNTQNAGSASVGAVVTDILTAGDSTLNIALTASAGSLDVNPFISGLTLEAIPEPSAAVLLLIGLGAVLFRRCRG